MLVVRTDRIRWRIHECNELLIVVVDEKLNFKRHFAFEVTALTHFSTKYRNMMHFQVAFFSKELSAAYETLRRLSLRYS